MAESLPITTFISLLRHSLTFSSGTASLLLTKYGS